MNKQQTTFNATDLWAAYVEDTLAKNPDYWTRWEPRLKRTAYIYKNTGKEVVEVMSWTRWYKIVQVYFTLGRKKVIAGGRFQLGHRLGAIQARTISRNFKNKQINWAETKKQPWVIDPVTGKRRRKRLIYYLSDRYSRIKWEKLQSISNERMYKFIPCKGNSAGKGFAREFSAALKADPTLELKYKQFTDELSID